MTSSGHLYLLAADAILVVHVLFVAFVIAGLLAVCIGGLRDWAWVRDLRFRVAHLLAIGFVVAETWLGVPCPLTVWEMALRARAGHATYAGDFVQHWLQALLYYTAPGWAFAVAYSLFGALVLASWFLVPPRRVRGTR
ncbi:MAG: DUF2784 domain-containing protein [Pseudomonadales bacterium]|jgi:hypothetical protein|nr:DUF2784 domain-containing protein [Pseudomonadales bacterium]